MKDAFCVRGFRASGVSAGIKKHGGLDLGLLAADDVVTAAGVFTTNRVQAPAVRLCRARLRRGLVRAILVNSGNANTAVGRRGMKDAQRCTAALGQALGVPASLVLMSSTGVIGEPLPAGKIIKALPRLVRGLSEGGLPTFAQAIMTTDTRPKLVQRRFVLGRKEVHLAGVAKGAGMIMPRMGTMLAYLLTDAAVNHAALKASLREAVNQSFNLLTVDGDTSTSDTVIALCSGRAGNSPLLRGSRQERVFCAALTELCAELADMIARDGEGATKMFRVEVCGAATRREADAVARRVANSLLVKTAFHAGDPNWGRVLAAAGSCGVRLDPHKMDLDFAAEHGQPRVAVVRGGAVAKDYREREAAHILQEKAFRVIINLHRGKERITITTCDLSAEYVRINAEYRS